MFVGHKRFENTLKFNFIYNKELPSMGSISERNVLPISDRLCNPKEVAPHTKTFSMHKKNDFVAQDKSVPVTPAQAALLTFLEAQNLELVINSLESIQENSLYFCEPDLVDLKSNLQVHLLLGHLSNLKN